MELNLQGRREGPRSANCLKPAAEIIVEDYCFCDNQTYISEGIANNHLAIVKHIILFFFHFNCSDLEGELETGGVL